MSKPPPPPPYAPQMSPFRHPSSDSDADESPSHTIAAVLSIDTVPSNLIEEDEAEENFPSGAASVSKSTKSFKSIATFLSTMSAKSTRTNKTNPYALPPPKSRLDDSKTGERILR